LKFDFLITGFYLYFVICILGFKFPGSIVNLPDEYSGGEI